MPTPPPRTAPSRPGVRRGRPGRAGRGAAGALLAVVLTAALALLGGAPAAAALPTPVPPVAFTTAPDAPSAYQGQKTCDPTEKPGATAMRALLLATYGKANAGGTSRACSVGGTSEHKEGRAYDWMLDATKPADKAMGDAFVQWLTAPDAQGFPAGNARRLGVQYVIWNRQTWQSWTGAWKSYTGASPHTDHVHISLSWDGAMQRTSWWTGVAVDQPDIGPCQLYVGEPVPPYSGPNYDSCSAPGVRDLRVVTADFDGDGRTDVATYTAGQFVVRTGAQVVRFGFGRSGDVPVAGDWDGDGKSGVGVFRDGRWFLRDALSAGPATRSFGFGRAGDRPLVGTWDGAQVGIGVHRGNQWFLRTSADGGAASAAFGWGRTTDLPVVGDWYGSGADSIGILRSGTFITAATARAGAPYRSVTFGHRDGVPAIGDWNRDGVTTPGTVKGLEHLWTDDPAGGSPMVSPVPY